MASTPAHCRAGCCATPTTTACTRNAEATLLTPASPRLRGARGTCEAVGEGDGVKGRTVMPVFRSPPDLEMHYQVDDFTDPWRTADAVLMLHGNAESGLAWYGWVPALARRYKVVRPDMRGFGTSTPMPRDFPWTLDVIIDDFVRLIDHLGIDRFHLVGAKIGGTIARAFAARRAERVKTLTVVGTPPPLRPGAKENVPALVEMFETHGVAHWARQNMGNRLGSAFPPEGF